jgi:hypothetical protein
LAPRQDSRQGGGLPAPSLRLDASIGGGPDSPAYELIVEVVRSLLPAMEKLGVATAADVGIDILGRRLREEVTAGGVVVAAPYRAWHPSPTSRALWLRRHAAAFVKGMEVRPGIAFDSRRS